MLDILMFGIQEIFSHFQGFFFSWNFVLVFDTERVNADTWGLTQNPPMQTTTKTPEIFNKPST